MDMVELEEALDDLLPSGYTIMTNRKGQVIIYTGLMDDDGELVPIDSEEDGDIDPDLVPLEDDDIDEE